MKKVIWAAIGAFLLVSCSPPSDGTSSATPDVGDAGHFAPDVAMPGTDVTHSDDSGRRDAAFSTEPDASEETWFTKRALTCDEERSQIEYPNTDLPFAKLGRGGLPKKTKGDIRHDFGNDLPDQAEYFALDPTLDPGRKMRAAFAERGEDVVIYYASIWDAVRPTDARLSVTTMVDYAPIEAEYILWNDDYSETQGRVTDTGAHFVIDEAIELVEVRIPAAAFPEDRYYELGFAARGGGAGAPGIGVSKRVALFYGGFDRDSHPCFEPTELEEPTDRETQLWGDHPDDGIVYPSTVQDPSSIWDSIQVEGGTKITANLALRGNLSGSDGHYVYVALFNGRPIRPAWYIVRAGADITDLTPAVTFRTSFDVEIPETPGIYDLIVVPFPAAFWPTGNPDGSWNEVRSFMSGGDSQILRLVVPPT